MLYLDHGMGKSFSGYDDIFAARWTARP